MGAVVQSVRVIVGQPWVLGGLLAVVILSLVSARELGQRWEQPNLLAGLAVASLGCIPVLTLYPAGPLGRYPQNCAGSLLAFPGLAPLLGTHDGLLNILLFVPAGTLVSAFTRRPAMTVASLILLSFVVEVVQGLLGSHSCTNVDWWANSLGAFLGAVFALLAKANIMTLEAPNYSAR
jgi:hypothetical protein